MKLPLGLCFQAERSSKEPDCDPASGSVPPWPRGPTWTAEPGVRVRGLKEMGWEREETGRGEERERRKKMGLGEAR